jgi:hypothetical protein
MNNNEPKLEVALTKCFFCGGDNEIVMNKVLTKRHAEKVKEMHGKVINTHPCPKCQEYMKQGVILISVRDGETGQNPYRTGGFVVVKDRALQGEAWEQAKKSRMCFVPDTVWDKLGLPMGK